MQSDSVFISRKIFFFYSIVILFGLCAPVTWGFLLSRIKWWKFPFSLKYVLLFPELSHVSLTCYLLRTSAENFLFSLSLFALQIIFSLNQSSAISWMDFWSFTASLSQGCSLEKRWVIAAHVKVGGYSACRKTSWDWIPIQNMIHSLLCKVCKNLSDCNQCVWISNVLL